MASLQNEIVWHVFWLVVFCSWNLEEGVLDHTEQDVPNRFRTINGAVEVPSAEIEFRGDSIELFICEWLIRVTVFRSVSLLAVNQMLLKYGASCERLAITAASSKMCRMVGTFCSTMPTRRGRMISRAM